MKYISQVIEPEEDIGNWSAAGRPRNGDCYRKMHAAKALYKNCLNTLRKDNIAIPHELNDCLLNKDSDSFWNCWRNKCGSPRVSPHSINGLSEHGAIAESFADFFSEVCVPNDDTHNTVLHDMFTTKFNSYVGSNLAVFVDSATVWACINKLKGVLASGYDGIMSQHLLYSHPIIYVLLPMLFRAIYVAGAFGSGINIPLLKDAYLDTTNMDNYTAITLHFCYIKAV